MVTDTPAKTGQTQSEATIADRAGELKERAGALFQEGVDAIKAHPGATAAVVGGVAAAAAAYAGRDKIAEAASSLRDKVNDARSSSKQAADKA